MFKLTQCSRKVVQSLYVKQYESFHVRQYLSSQGKSVLYSIGHQLSRKVFISGLGTTSLIMAFLPFSSKPAENNTLSLKEVLLKADHLYDKLSFQELYDHLVLYKDTRNDEILWRLARATYEKTRDDPKKENRKAAFAEALTYAKMAEEINPNNFAVHKWIAILTDSYHSLEGTKARIQHLFEMKLHMETACELKPNDGTSWYVLGMWYYGIADISWYERKAASLFFATPPQATYEDALKIFLKAEKMEPNFYSKNLLMISKCLLSLGQKEEARMYLKQTMAYPVKTADDQESNAEATKLFSTV